MKSRKEKELTKQKAWYVQKIKIISFGIFIVSLIVLFNQVSLSRYFPIKTVKVYGANHVNRQEIENLLLPILQQGFFSVDIQEIRDKLSEITWISGLFIKRIWPDQIEIALIEKQPIARWNQEDLITEKGELFLPTTDDAPIHLAELSGPSGKQSHILAFYQELNRLLRPLQVKVSKLELTPYYTWNIELNNQVKLQVGYQNAVSRLMRFVKVYPKIVGERAHEVNYIDLRYSNGMAVKWKTNHLISPVG